MNVIKNRSIEVVIVIRATLSIQKLKALRRKVHCVWKARGYSGPHSVSVSSTSHLRKSPEVRRNLIQPIRCHVDTSLVSTERCITADLCTFHHPLCLICLHTYGAPITILCDGSLNVSKRVLEDISIRSKVD